MLIDKIITELDNSILEDGEKKMYYDIAKNSDEDLQLIIIEILKEKEPSKYSILRNKLVDYIKKRTNETKLFIKKNTNLAYKLAEEHSIIGEQKILKNLYDI